MCFGFHLLLHSPRNGSGLPRASHCAPQVPSESGDRVRPCWMCVIMKTTLRPTNAMHPQTHTDQAPSPLTPSQQFLRGIGITNSVPPAEAVYYHYLALQRQYAFRRHESSSTAPRTTSKPWRKPRGRITNKHWPNWVLSIFLWLGQTCLRQFLQTPRLLFGPRLCSPKQAGRGFSFSEALAPAVSPFLQTVYPAFTRHMPASFLPPCKKHNQRYL